MKRPIIALSVAIAFAATASAQQFTAAGTLPVPSPGPATLWSEGVECSDVDRDGDLDIFFTNGNGFASPGAQQQQSLVINRLEVAPGTFADESIARLGVAIGHGRSAIARDINDDGWEDCMIVNAFNTDPPFLFMNRGTEGSAFEGVFSEEGATRGFTEALSSGGAQFGDLDNDGDLDVIICDSGVQYLGGAGDRPNLYFNDGTGHFTEDAVAMNAVVKDQHMDVQLYDVDGDWDLDFIGDNHSPDQYLMLNDGLGNFTDASGLLPTVGTSYELEASDLDGDEDIDLFFINLSGFNEGAMRNNFAGTGTLSFTKLGSSGGVDDNEIALLDYDNDGDLDAMIASLGGTEKVMVNNGGLSFTSNSALIQSVNDSSLDITAADLDNDGDYDLVTAQGESGNFTNRWYRNTGGADNIDPVIVREETVDAFFYNQPAVVRGEVRDQVMDDSRNWVRALAFVTYIGSGNPQTAVPATYSAGGIYRFDLGTVTDCNVTAIQYQLVFRDYQSNQTSGPIHVVDVCGACQYGLEFSPATNTMSLAGSGDPSLGGLFTVTATDLPNPNGVMLTALALGEGSFPFFSGQALFDPTALLEPILNVSVASGGTGTFSVTIPTSPTLAGVNVFFQSGMEDPGTPGDFELSNGVRLTICD